MSKKIFNQTLLKSNLQYLLDYTPLTISELAKNKIASKGYLSFYLNNNDRLLGSDIVRKLSEYVNIPIDILLNNDLKKENKVFDIKNDLYMDNKMNHINTVVNKPNEKYEFIEPRRDEVTEIPLYESAVAAGIPKEVMDYPLMKIAVGPIKKGAFAVKVSGDSMIDFKIDDGDTLVVFPTSELKYGQLVVARCGNAYTVKKLVMKDDKISLVPGNKEYEPIEIKNESEIEIIGYVLYIMKKPYLNGNS